MMLPQALQLEIERISPGASKNVSSCAYIEAVENLRDQYEKQVSQKRTRNQETHDRDMLARNLKELVMGCSPRLRKDPLRAENLVAEVFENVLGIRFPSRESEASDFAAMFGHKGKRARKHAEEQIAEAKAFAAAEREEL